MADTTARVAEGAASDRRHALRLGVQSPRAARRSISSIL